MWGIQVMRQWKQIRETHSHFNTVDLLVVLKGLVVLLGLFRRKRIAIFTSLWMMLLKFIL